MRKVELGKIERISFGYGGYQDAQFGVSFTLGGDGGWGVSDFWGHWGMDPSESARWDKHDQVKGLGETCLRLRDLMKHAKVKTVDELTGIPIEATFDDMKLESWRVLKEVL